jgi:UrcA family protein
MMTKLMIAAIGVAAALPMMADAATARPGTMLTALEKQVAVRVAYDDLDLATPSGLHTMQHRLSDAGRAACTAAFKDAPFAAQQVNTCLTMVRTSSHQQLAAVIAAAQAANRNAAQLADNRRP